MRDLSSAIAAVVGGVAGDSAFNAQVAGVIGQNAVENNGLGAPRSKDNKRLIELVDKCNNPECLVEIISLKNKSYKELNMSDKYIYDWENTAFDQYTDLAASACDGNSACISTVYKLMLVNMYGNAGYGNAYMEDLRKDRVSIHTRQGHWGQLSLQAFEDFSFLLEVGPAARLINNGVEKFFTRSINAANEAKILNMVSEAGHEVVASRNGFISSGKLNKSSILIDTATHNEDSLVNLVLRFGDKSGRLKEELVNSVFEKAGLNLLPGGKYGSNLQHGFDHVYKSADGAIHILDTKPKNIGGVQLSTKAAGDTNQLSSDWINAVINRLPDNDASKIAIKAAMDKGLPIKTYISTVDKVTGNIQIIAVDVPNKG
ncbi:VENN motif pre-toxin domain-containing protein [Pseudomonas sp. F1_0610]